MMREANSTQNYLVDGKYSFKDLVDPDRLQGMLKRFFQASGYAVSLFSFPDQELLVTSGWSDICLEFHNSLKASEEFCKQSCLELKAGLKEHKLINIHHCKNGLVSGLIPITIKGKQLASLFTGQVLFSKPDIDMFKKQGEKYGFDIKKYLEALDRVPVVTEEGFKDVVGLLSDIVVIVAEHGLAEIENREVVNLEKDHEAKTYTILNSIGDAVIATDLDGNITEMNAAAEKLTGWSIEKAKAKPLKNVFRIIRADGGKAPVLEVIGEGKIVGLSSNTLLKSRDGNEYHISDLCAPIQDIKGNTTGAVLVFRDVTEEYNLREDLRKNEDRLSKILIAANDGTWDWDLRTDAVYFDARYYKMAGYEVDEFPHTLEEFKKRIHPDDIETVMGTAEKHLKGEIDRFIVEFRFVRKSGGWIWILGRGIIVERAEDGTPTRFVGTHTDITDRKRAEEKLKESENNLRTLFNAMQDVVFEVDYDGYYINIAPTSPELLFKPAEDVLGKKLSEVFTKPEADHFLKVIRESLDNKKKISVEYPLIINGKTIWFEGTATPKTKNTVLYIARDITDRKLAEEELQRKEKLESIGILAGGIAHDFNNIMMGLFGNISIAKGELIKGHPAYGFLDDAEKSMGRAIQLTKQLLTFSKGGEPVTEDVKICELIEEVVRFDLSGSNVMPVFDWDEDLWMAEADKGQVQQVFSNLAINAVQAMPDGGHLFVKLENKELSENEVPDLIKGKYIKVIVRDEGIGIDKKHLDKIFDPYFSTKQKGSGLGLAMTYSIINKHGGRIFVDSEFGNGTTFTLYLPATDTQRQEESEHPDSRDSYTGESGRILVMDDEEAILKVARKILEKKGYSVETAPGGEKAIEMYKESIENGDSFDAVIMDITIPGGVGGKKAVKRILEIDPEARCIVSSGYTNDPLMSNYAEYGFKGVVTKPYTSELLLELLSKVLKK